LEREYGSKFWLVDVDGDGRDELITPSSLGLNVSHSDGIQGFSSPEPLLAANNLDYRAVRFGDVNKDGLPDVVAWIGGTVYVYLNNGRGFSAPIAASADFPVSAGFGEDQYLSTMQVADVNGDGCADLMFRGPADVFVGLSDCQGKFLPAASWTRRFSDRQNFALSSQNLTFSAATIAGKAGLAAGLLPAGSFFSKVMPRTVASANIATLWIIMDSRETLISIPTLTRPMSFFPIFTATATPFPSKSGGTASTSPTFGSYRTKLRHLQN
jgi:hypothetical protein